MSNPPAHFGSSFGDQFGIQQMNTDGPAEQAFPMYTGPPPPQKYTMNNTTQSFANPTMGSQFMGAPAPPMVQTSPLEDTRPTKRSRDSYEAAFSPTSPASSMSFDVGSPMSMPNSPMGVNLSPMPGDNNLPVNANMAMNGNVDLNQYLALFEHTENHADASAARNASANAEDPLWFQHFSVAQQVIGRLEERVSHFKSTMDEIRYKQKHMPVPPNVDAYRELDQAQKSVMNEINVAQGDLFSILSSVLLDPITLCKMQALSQEFEIATSLLMLFQQELMSMAQGHSSECYARLMITKQPFPKCVKQNTRATSATDDPVVVCLLIAPKAEVQLGGNVRAELQHEDYQAKRGSFSINNDSQPMDNLGIATFPDLKFPHGTRTKMVRVRFGVEVQYIHMGGSMARTMLQSDLSAPFIVMTNENQWEASAGALLKKDIFDRNPEVSWQLILTKARNDLHYIHEKLFNQSPMISERDYDGFWAWFGKVLHRIRHQKHFSPLWMNGFIYGFISKQNSERLLQGESPGSCIIRFSEQLPGKVALAYVKARESLPSGFNTIKHVLVDRTANESQIIPDYVNKKETLAWMMKVDTAFNPSHSIETKEHKDVVLSEYIAKGEGLETARGYDLD